MPTLHELYKTLEINKNATPEEIKQARDRLAKKWHPDKNNNSEESKIKFQKIQDAYEVLTNSQRRDEYNDLVASAQHWLDTNYPKQKSSSRDSSKYIILSNGEKQYISPSRSVLTNPVTSLDAIRNQGLEGSLSLVDFTNLEELDLTGNKITSLDVNNCPKLRLVRCDNNPITSLKLVNRNTFAIEVHFSYDELLEEKRKLENLNKKLEEQIISLEKEKNSLDEKFIELKDLNKRNKERLERERDSRPNVTLEEWKNDYSQRPTREQLVVEQLAKSRAETDAEDKSRTIQQLQGQIQITSSELVASREINEKLKSEKDDLGRRLEELIRTKYNLESNHRIQIREMETKHNKAVQVIRDKSNWELDQERDKYNLLIGDKKNIEDELRTQKQKSQNLDRVLSDTLDRANELERMLNDKKNEFTNVLRVHQSEIENKQKEVTHLKGKNSSLEQLVNQLNEQLVNSKKQWLKSQETELNELIAKLIVRLDDDYQDELDDLLKAQEELNKDSNNFLAQRQLKKSKTKLARKLEEAEIDAVLTKKKEVWNLKLEFLDETTKITVMENLKRDSEKDNAIAMAKLEKEKAIAEKEKAIKVMKLENDIDKKQNNFKQLLDSTKEKLKKKSKNLIKNFSSSKEEDYQSHLEKFLEFQESIIRSEDNQEIRELLGKQLQFKQNLVKKLNEEELENIRLAKEELTKLEIERSILISSSNDNQQEYYSQVQVPPVPPKNK